MRAAPCEISPKITTARLFIPTRPRQREIDGQIRVICAKTLHLSPADATRIRLKYTLIHDHKGLSAAHPSPTSGPLKWRAITNVSGEEKYTVADRSLDTTGLTCPIPILKAKKALAEMAQGTVLEIVATDPAAPKDFVAFCRATGHTLVDTSEQDGTFRFLIQRA